MAVPNRPEGQAVQRMAPEVGLYVPEGQLTHVVAWRTESRTNAQIQSQGPHARGGSPHASQQHPNLGLSRLSGRLKPGVSVPTGPLDTT